MSHFFLKLIAPRPNFANDVKEQEKTLMQNARGHARHHKLMTGGLPWQKQQ
jgi:hypothetical protein